MLIAHNVLIMALDGARMSLFRNKGSVRAPDLELLVKDKYKALSTADLGDDQPGRVFQSSGAAHAAYETTDLHQRAEDDFVSKIAELFIIHMRDADRKAILIAPPKVLGLIRKHLPKEIRQRLIAEIDKDYAGRSALDVAELLNRYEV
jgi:protein required for attachment to host cells